MPTAVQLPGLPAFLDSSQNSDQILAAMLATIPPGLDISEGSFIWDALAPVALELATAAANAQQALARSFAETTFGAYLDLRVAEHGLTRLPAVAATGTLHVIGAPGTTIPDATVFSTASSTAVPAVLFQTVGAAVIPGGGAVDIPIRAVVAGALGNVSANAITFFATGIPGATSAANPAVTTGGLDTESDAALLSRYLIYVANPAAGGNAADYTNWALSVPGVGKVVVVPIASGAGTVALSIVDTNLAVPTQALVDAVQNYIAPPVIQSRNAAAFTLGGFGASIDATQTDAPLGAVKFVYNVSGDGTATLPTINTFLGQAGLWWARPTIKVDSVAGVTNVLELGIWNVTTAAWAKTTAAGSTDAHFLYHATALTTTFQPVIVPFFWNGTDTIELRVLRKTTDTATLLWLYQGVFRSQFSDRNGAGQAPIGAQVSVNAPSTLTINVAATLTIDTNYVTASVRAAATAAITAYLKSIVFAADRTVRYTRIANAILDTPGIVDYASLLISAGGGGGSTANIAISATQIPIIGTVTWS